MELGVLVGFGMLWALGLLTFEAMQITVDLSKWDEGELVVGDLNINDHQSIRTLAGGLGHPCLQRGEVW